MISRKLLGGLVAAGAASVMLLGAVPLAQAATTATASPVAVTNRASVAPNSVTTFAYCNNWIPLHPDSGIWEGRGQLPASSTYSPNCILEKGNISAGVTVLQRQLNSCYQKGLADDGIFGTATYNALLAVQRKISATIDGIYGPATRNKMLWDSGTGCHPITYYQGF